MGGTFAAPENIRLLKGALSLDQIFILASGFTHVQCVSGGETGIGGRDTFCTDLKVRGSEGLDK